MSNDLEKFLKVASNEESIELQIFHNAVIKNMKAYQESPTKKNRDNLDAARESLARKKEELMNKYFDNPGADPWQGAPDVFVNISAVAKFVAGRFKTSGNKTLSERTVRGHLQGRGKKGKLLFPRPEGGYALKDVQDYAGRMGFVALDADPEADDKDVSRRSLEIMNAQEEKKLEKLALQNRRLEFELAEKEKAFVRLDDLDAELAARGLALRHFLERHFEDHINTIFEMDRAGALQLLMDAVNQALNDYVSLDAFYVLRPEKEEK